MPFPDRGEASVCYPIRVWLLWRVLWAVADALSGAPGTVQASALLAIPLGLIVAWAFLLRLCPRISLVLNLGVLALVGWEMLPETRPTNGEINGPAYLWSVDVIIAAFGVIGSAVSGAKLLHARREAAARLPVATLPRCVARPARTR